MNKIIVTLALALSSTLAFAQSETEKPAETPVRSYCIDHPERPAELRVEMLEACKAHTMQVVCKQEFEAKRFDVLQYDNCIKLRKYKEASGQFRNEAFQEIQLKLMEKK